MAQVEHTSAPYRAIKFGTSAVELERRPDGVIIARSPTPL